MESVTPRVIMHKEKVLDKAEVILLLSHILSRRKEEILSRLDEPLSIEKFEELRIRLEERKKGKPIAYIIGRKEFFSLEFLVTESTLIPRPETEILVNEALRIIEEGHAKTVLDCGTGCGAIGITIAKLKDVNVVCLDLSKDALRVAKKNSVIHGVSERVGFICSDLLTSLKGKFDLICANLPYVSEGEYQLLPPDIRDYEPKLALYGGKEGLEVIMRFIEGVESYISDSGHLLLEIGSEKQSRIVGELLTRRGFSVSLIKDYSGMERVLRAKWKSS